MLNRPPKWRKVYREAGVKSLEEAITRGKTGNAGAATGDAELALGHFRAGNK